MELSPQERVWRSITEEDWQRKVIAAAVLLGWGFWHDTNIRKRMPGLPDLILWRPRNFMGCELKTETGELTAKQELLLRAWDLAGIETHVWRPSMWIDVEVRLRTR